jgi:hypothetical protein
MHADFDWDGVAIVAAVAALGAEPWRMSSGDFATATTAAAAYGRPLPTLTGTPTASPWSPGLQQIMQARQVEVHEEDEGILATLLQDLMDLPPNHEAVRHLESPANAGCRR